MNKAPSIHVDNLTPALRSARWKWDEAAHLFVFPGDPVDKSLEALHHFAAKIGLRREWFQETGTMPHYDLNPGRHRAAIAAGAILTDRDRTVEAIRAWREVFKPCRECGEHCKHDDPVRPCRECGELIAHGAWQHTCNVCLGDCCTSCSHDGNAGAIICNACYQHYKP